MNDKDDKSKLREFVLYLEQNNDFDEYKLGFNIFSILKMERREEIHSNVLAYFLNPNESHNLGDSFLKRFILHISQKKDISVDMLEIINLDYSQFEVYTEKPHDIDIFLLNKNDKYVIVIENKINSDVHSSTGYDSQLDKYKENIDKEHNDEFTKVYLLLTPDGKGPIEDGWEALSYGDITQMFEHILADDINENVKTFINYYVNLLKKRISPSKTVKNLCQEIYNKYKDAIDLINANKDDERKLVGDSIKKLFSEIKKNNSNLIFNDETKETIYISFSTKRLDQYFEEFKGKCCFSVEGNMLYLCYPAPAKENAKSYCRILEPTYKINKFNQNYALITKLDGDNLMNDLEKQVNMILLCESK